MMTAAIPPKPPFTQAVRRALQGVNDTRLEADLLFLEAWEIHPSPHLGVTLRASQIRRANPVLAAEIDAELKKLKKLKVHASGAVTTGVESRQTLAAS